MYGITKEEVFLLLVLVLATLIGYVVFISSGSLLYALSAGFSVFLLLIGAKLYAAETYEEKVLGSIAMASAFFIVVTTIYGLPAGIIASLSLLACCLALIYFLS